MFKKRTFVEFATAAGLLVSVSVASAEILDLNIITRDTDTGLDWLDVTETQGLSYDQVSALLLVGERLEGWRYATIPEVDQLIMNFGYERINSSCSYGALHCDTFGGDSPLVELMIKTLGDTGNRYYDTVDPFYDVPANGAGYVRGLTGTFTTNGTRLWIAEIFDNELIVRSTGDSAAVDPVDHVRTEWGSLLPPQSRDQLGSFLVRSSQDDVLDSDSDGVIDSNDNCPSLVNPDQSNSDGDALGDVCDIDLNNDGRVNFLDLAALRNVFGSNNPDADLNDDGIVNFIDLARFKSLF